jgi:hypothetical protein
LTESASAGGGSWNENSMSQIFKRRLKRRLILGEP